MKKMTYFYILGNLHFAHVRKEDSAHQRSYVCVVQNQVMRRTMHGAYQSIVLTGGKYII